MNCRYSRALHRQVDAEERLAEGFPRPLGALQGIEGGQPVGGQALAGLGVAVALHRRTRIDAFADAAVDPGEEAAAAR